MERIKLMVFGVFLVSFLIISVGVNAQNDWWNTSYNHRRTLSVNNTINLVLEFEPIEVNITDMTDLSNCYKEIRVTQCNQENQACNSETEIPVQVLNGDNSTFCEIIFQANISTNSYREYFVYYSNPNATIPNYTSETNLTSGGVFPHDFWIAHTYYNATWKLRVSGGQKYYFIQEIYDLNGTSNEFFSINTTDLGTHNYVLTGVNQTRSQRPILTIDGFIIKEIKQTDTFSNNSFSRYRFYNNYPWIKSLAYNPPENEGDDQYSYTSFDNNAVTCWLGNSTLFNPKAPADKWAVESGWLACNSTIDEVFESFWTWNNTTDNDKVLFFDGVIDFTQPENTDNTVYDFNAWYRMRYDTTESYEETESGYQRFLNPPIIDVGAQETYTLAVIITWIPVNYMYLLFILAIILFFIGIFYKR